MVYKADPITSQGLVISIPEIVLIIWVATFAVELFRKVYFTILIDDIILYLYIYINFKVFSQRAKDV